MKSIKKIRNNCPYYKLITLLLPLTLILLPSCAMKNRDSAPDDFQIAYLEKEISALDKKIEEIYHRVSVIQFMVDNHDRQLQGNGVNVIKSSAPVSEGKVFSTPADTGRGNTTPQVLFSSAPTSSAVNSFSDESPETLYKKGLAAYKNNNFEQAVACFETFVQKYPDNDYADNALYWAGESHYSEKDYNAAIKAFKTIPVRYPDGGKVPDALLKTGYTYLELNDPQSAKIYLKNVIKKYPFSPAAAKAEQMLAKLQ